MPDLRPAIVQDADSGRVLMLAWMDDEAERLTREQGEAWFWSRSRERLWHKGETSGNTLAVVELRDDCDGDALLLRVRPAGPTCHTGSRVVLRARALADDRAACAGPAGRLVHRRSSSTQASARARARSARRLSRSRSPRWRESDERVVEEAADLVYHLYVLLASRGLDIAQVEDGAQQRGPDRPAGTRQRHVLGLRECRESLSVHDHVGVLPVAVRLAAPRGVALAVVAARQALRVPDHVRERDVEAARVSHSVSRRDAESWRGLPRICASLVPTCSMPIAVQLRPTVWRQIVVERHELVDRPVAIDDEVRTRPGALAELGVRRVGGERRPHRREAVRRGVVLDDHVRRGQPPGCDAVVALRVRRRLGAALRAEGDRLRDDRRLRRRDETRRDQQ